MPPISNPASTSVPAGTSADMWPAKARSTEKRSVQLWHGYGLRARPAGATLDGILDDEPLGAVARMRPVDLQQVRPEARVVLAQSP